MSVTLGSSQDESTVGLLPNGRPDPRYALALGFVPASALKRSFAFVIDIAIWLAIALISVLGTLPLWLRLRPDIFSIGWLIDHSYFGIGLIFFIVGQALLLVYGLVQLILHGMAGKTIGKAVLGLRTVRVDTFARPGFWRIVARAIIVWLAFLAVPVFGALVLLLSPLWDSEHRGRSWHDKAVGCWMLDVRRGLKPTDTKGLRLARKALATDAPLEAAAPLPSLATRADQAAAVDFVPSSRSSSGVIAAHHSAAHAEAKQPWQPPPLGGPQAEQQQLAPAPTAAPSPGRAPAPAPAPAPAAPAGAVPPLPAEGMTLREPLEEFQASARAMLAESEAKVPAQAQPQAPLAPQAPAPASSQAPAAPGATPAPAAPASASGAVFRFDSGASVGIDGTGLLGRNPHPQPGEDVLHLLPIADESLQISKTHAAFGIDDRGFWITDRNSSNGTAVISPAGVRTELTAGQRLYLEWGTTVEVGGRSFVVVPA